MRPLSSFDSRSPEIKKVWEERKTISTNLKEIGLAWDPNKVIAIPSARSERIKMIKQMNGFVEEDNAAAAPAKVHRPKGHVLEQMEIDANALRASNFRLPKGLVAHLTYMMDKHKLNYKAMVYDSKNYDQWTWKQFRAKCRKLMDIPQQFGPYLASRSIEQDTLDWVEYSSDSEI